jgi:predicted acetyltransferase
MPDGVEYRFARPAEIGAVGRMVAHSFPGPSRPPEWWEEQLGSPAYGGGADTLFLAVLAGRPVAACQIHPLQQWVAGVRLATAGIGTVAASPVHRKQRLGALMMAEALRAARERGDVASALYPFRTSFYQKLGYGAAGEAVQYQISPGMLRDSPERVRVELLEDDAGRAEALALYNRWAPTQNGQLERGERVWRQLCAVHDRALVGYRGQDGELHGYALATYRTDLPNRERLLEIDELVWTDDAARRALYGWVSSMDDQWPQLLIRGLPSHRLGDWIREPRLPRGTAPLWGLWAPAATLMAGTMFRILELQGAWTRRRPAAGASLTVGLEVRDAQIPENAGAWRLVFEDGQTGIERGDAPSADLTLRLDITTLSRLFVAALPASAALEAGLLECDAPAKLPALDAALALPQPWTFDRF